MALLKIARMGHPVLRQPADSLRDLHAPAVQRLIADMTETMYDADGLGLAAPQVHESLRVIVFHVPAGRRPEADGEAETEDGASADAASQAAVPLTVLINPRFEPLDSRQTLGWEGCLSIPGLMGRVPRYRQIRYWGLDPAGREIRREATGLHARVVQHECDHLDGILYPERMTDLLSLCFTSELDRIAEHGADPRPAPVAEAS